jgi:hypothetical protein
MSSIFTYVQSKELQNRETQYNSNQRAFLNSVTTRPYKQVYDENDEYLNKKTENNEKNLDETYKNIQSKKLNHFNTAGKSRAFNETKREYVIKLLNIIKMNNKELSNKRIKYSALMKFINDILNITEPTEIEKIRSIYLLILNDFKENPDEKKLLERCEAIISAIIFAQNIAQSNAKNIAQSNAKSIAQSNAKSIAQSNAKNSA